MSRSYRGSKIYGVSPFVKEVKNFHSRMDRRKLSGLTLEECTSYVDFWDYSCEIFEDPSEVLDLGSDKKYKKTSNKGFCHD